MGAPGELIDGQPPFVILVFSSSSLSLTRRDPPHWVAPALFDDMAWARAISKDIPGTAGVGRQPRMDVDERGIDRPDHRFKKT